MYPTAREVVEDVGGYQGALRGAGDLGDVVGGAGGDRAGHGGADHAVGDGAGEVGLDVTAVECGDQAEHAERVSGHQNGSSGWQRCGIPPAWPNSLVGLPTPLSRAVSGDGVVTGGVLAARQPSSSNRYRADMGHIPLYGHAIAYSRLPIGVQMSRTRVYLGYKPSRNSKVGESCSIARANKNSSSSFSSIAPAGRQLRY